MTENKQIEEMAKEICAKCKFDTGCSRKICTMAYREAEFLVELGYAKASDVAREIFEEIDNRLDNISVVPACADEFTMGVGKTFEKVTGIVEELKKKYIGENK